MNGISIKDIKWHKKTNKICQIPKEGLEFAMLSPKYEQLNQLVWCKDFMQDIIWSYVNQRTVEIYGFTYDPHSCPSPSLRKLRLMVSNYKDDSLGTKIFNNVLPLLHSVEERMKMPKTVLEKANGTPPLYRKSGIWILNGSKRWLKAPPLISLYTLLIRIGLVHQAGDSLEQTLRKVSNGDTVTYYDPDKRDKSVVYQAKAGILDIVRCTDRLFPASMKENYPTHYKQDSSMIGMSLYNIHDRCGIVGFSEKTARRYFPQWYEYEKEKR